MIMSLYLDCYYNENGDGSDEDNIETSIHLFDRDGKRMVFKPFGKQEVKFKKHQVYKKLSFIPSDDTIIRFVLPNVIIKNEVDEEYWYGECYSSMIESK